MMQTPSDRPSVLDRVRSIPRWIWVPAALGLVVRVAVVVGQIKFELFQLSFDAGDSGLYRALANDLFHHGRFAVEGESTAYVTPGYPIFLAVLRVVSDSTLWIALVQSVVGALTVVLVADITRRLAGVQAAWLAGLAVALYPHFLFWTGYVLTETLFVFGLALSTWLVVRLVEGPTPLRALTAGMAFAGTGLVRPMVFLYAALVIVAGLLYGRWRRYALMGIGGMLLLWAPWIVRNAVTMDAFVPTSTESGYVLWQGNSPDATGGTRGYVDLADFKPLPPPEEPLSEAASDRRYGREAVEWMVGHPLEVIELAPRKLANMFRPTYAGASALNVAVTLATFPALILLGVTGVPLLWRRALNGRLIVALLAFFLLIHALITGMIRFRLPVEMILVVPGALAASALLDRIRDRVRS
jgi:4-amino-4-deoxy-L-arabinose transferase-like glycosyltransferase